MDKFLEWMRMTNYSERTVENRQLYLSYFIIWAEDRGLTRPTEITKPILERYQRYLLSLPQERWPSAHVPFTAFAAGSGPAWFKWLTKNNHILYNPASELELPKLERRLPKHVLTIREAEAVPAVVDLSQPLGVRDRANPRNPRLDRHPPHGSEHLRLYDVDVDRGTLMIRQGKGKKDRMVPIGDRALTWIDRYLSEVRHA